VGSAVATGVVVAVAVADATGGGGAASVTVVVAVAVAMACGTAALAVGADADTAAALAAGVSLFSPRARNATMAPPPTTMVARMAIQSLERLPLPLSSSIDPGCDDVRASTADRWLPPVLPVIDRTAA
jgi:hypothetical protein